jgi:hypothetical protein
MATQTPLEIFNALSPAAQAQLVVNADNATKLSAQNAVFAAFDTANQAAIVNMMAILFKQYVDALSLTNVQDLIAAQGAVKNHVANIIRGSILYTVPKPVINTPVPLPAAPAVQATV